MSRRSRRLTEQLPAPAQAAISAMGLMGATTDLTGMAPVPEGDEPAAPPRGGPSPRPPVAPAREHRVFKYSVGSGCNALSPSPDGTQVVVAGREVLRILDVNDEDGVKERLNLRIGKAMNLNSCSNDVKWHPLEYHKNLIATAATNGSVVIWNLDLQGQKQERVITEHARTVNHVSWHRTEGNLLISGSQDGTIKLWDVRDCTSSKMTFTPKAESVRDVKFSPYYSNYFAAGFENGNLQVWDLRKPNICERSITAHRGLVLTVDWHPDDRSVLASGGRDRCIKVWDVNNPAKPTHMVQTIASVGHIKWRPLHRHQIAGAASLMDSKVHLWDVSKPFIPKVSFVGHRDVATGFYWSSVEADRLMSCSKDGHLIHHWVDQAYNPYEDVCSVAVSWSVHSDIVAVTEKIDRANIADSPQQNFSSLFGITPVAAGGGSAHERTGRICIASAEADPFVYLAKHYSFRSDDLDAACRHNAQVAEDAGATQAAQSWRIVGLLCATDGFTQIGGGKDQKKASGDGDGDGGGDGTGNTSTDGDGGDAPPKPQGPNPAATRPSPQAEPKPEPVRRLTNPLPGPPVSGSPPGRKVVVPKNEGLRVSTLSTSLAEAATMALPTQLEVDPGAADLDSDWLEGSNTLPEFTPTEESELLKQKLGEFVTDEEEPGMEYLGSDNVYPLSPLVSVSLSPTRTFAGATGAVRRAGVAAGGAAGGMGGQEGGGGGDDGGQRGAAVMPRVLFDPQPILAQTIEFFAEQGDVQMCVGLVRVLGKRIEMEPQMVEQWHHEYIELLNRHRLFLVAAELIRTSELTVINTMSQKSTTLYSACGRCSKPLPKDKEVWYCQECLAFSAPCSICRLPVKGVYVWCQGCGHGGHMEHLQSWFDRFSVCPHANCNHECNIATVGAGRL